MSLFDSTVPDPQNALQGAQRIRRALVQSFDQVEATLAQVRQISDRHGASDIQVSLGNDKAEVARLYLALKTLVEQYKPGASIPEMPITGGPK